MSQAFCENDFIGRRHITKVKVDRWLCLVFVPGKICKETKPAFSCLYYAPHLYECMKSLSNDVYNLCVNTHVLNKIYPEVYHGIIYI